jgi:ARC6-like, IMS domain
VSAKKSRSLCSILALSFVLATMTSPNSTAAVAQNNDSSMDSVNDNGAIDAKPASRKSSVAAQSPAPARASDKNADAASETSADDSNTALRRPRRRRPSTPLTTVDAFARSPIIQGGGWPGIGPFRPSKDNNSLVDKATNSMKIEATDQKQITAVELTLIGAAAMDPLGVEMTCDFLLEALGIKPARIADFNGGLERQKSNIYKDSKVVGLTAGRYKVSLKPKSGENRTLTVRIESPEIVFDASDDSGETPPKPKHGPFDFGDMWKHIVPVPDDSPPPKIEQPSDSSKGKTTVTKLSPSGDLKVTFKDLVQNWQKIKRNAVKNRDISELPNVLSGHALAVQTGGIKWLSSKHQYYEMVPMAVEVNSVTELVKDKKYSVIATVKESSKLYDDQNNQLLREAEDTYHVNYTVEKEGDKYVISDSSIIKLGEAANQTPADTGKKH